MACLNEPLQDLADAGFYVDDGRDQDENARLRDQLARRDRELAGCKKELAQLRAKAGTKDGELAKCKQELAELRAQAENKDKELTKYEQELAQLWAKTGTKDKELVKLKASEWGARRQVDELKRQNATISDESAKRLETNKRLRDELLRLKCDVLRRPALSIQKCVEIGPSTKRAKRPREGKGGTTPAKKQRRAPKGSPEPPAHQVYTSVTPKRNPVQAKPPALEEMKEEVVIPFSKEITTKMKTSKGKKRKPRQPSKKSDGDSLPPLTGRELRDSVLAALRSYPKEATFKELFMSHGKRWPSRAQTGYFIVYDVLVSLQVEGHVIILPIKFKSKKDKKWSKRRFKAVHVP